MTKIKLKIKYQESLNYQTWIVFKFYHLTEDIAFIENVT
jgi:hypothetical protein